MSALTLASQTIGFISFSITLLTLLGVYSSLLSSMRTAPTQIPITLGNLRQEILAERAYLRQRTKEGRDPFCVFPRELGGRLRSSSSQGGGKEGKEGEMGKMPTYARLLSYTIRDLWLEFQRLERPFLVKGAMRAEAIRGGDYWSDKDVDFDVEDDGSGASSASSRDNDGPRQRRRRRRRRRRQQRGAVAADGVGWAAEEEDLRREGSKYYNTDMTHRFIWWQCEDEVRKLADQVGRIQIRRMERDIFETDELVRTLMRWEVERRGGDGGRGERDRDRRPSGGGGSGGGSASESEDIVTRSRAGSRAPSRSRRASRGRAGEQTVREVEETERIVRSNARSPRATSTRRQSEREHGANVAARRTERRRGEPVTEYEVLRPGGGGYVVVDDYRGSAVPRGARVYEIDSRRSGDRRLRSFSGTDI